MFSVRPPAGKLLSSRSITQISTLFDFDFLDSQFGTRVRSQYGFNLAAARSWGRCCQSSGFLVIRQQRRDRETRRRRSGTQRQRFRNSKPLLTAASGGDAESNAESSLHRLDFIGDLVIYEYEKLLACQQTTNTPSMRNDNLHIFRSERLSFA